MTNTIAQVIAYARAHPTNNGGSWHNWCEAFVYRAGNFGQSFGTAQMAGDASGPLNRSYALAPAGAIHYWGGGGVGHVGFELGGGLVLMASDGVTTLWGTAMGTATVPAYNARKPSMSYRGWSLRHGMQTLNLISTAGTPITPISAEDDMNTIEGIYANANGSPSWAWLNWANGSLTSVHTQKDADWVGSYMGSVEVLKDTPGSSAADKYNAKIAMLKILNPAPAVLVDATTTGTPTVTDAQLDTLAGKIAKLIPGQPTSEQIAAEVIRQQKLPGN